jgi:hypothetical protein
MYGEIGKKGSPIKVALRYELAKYGPTIIELGIALLQGRRITPYNFIDHALLLSPAKGQAPSHGDDVIGCLNQDAVTG